MGNGQCDTLCMACPNACTSCITPWFSVPSLSCLKGMSFFAFCLLFHTFHTLSRPYEHIPMSPCGWPSPEGNNNAPPPAAPYRRCCCWCVVIAYACFAASTPNILGSSPCSPRLGCRDPRHITLTSAARRNTAGSAMRYSGQHDVTWGAAQHDMADGATRHSGWCDVMQRAARRNMGTAAPWHSSIGDCDVALCVVRVTRVSLDHFYL